MYMKMRSLFAFHENFGATNAPTAIAAISGKIISQLLSKTAAAVIPPTKMTAQITGISFFIILKVTPRRSDEEFFITSAF